jgi:voltage-gated sodium channel
MQQAVENLPGWRGDIERFMALSFIQNFLIVLIVVNAIILGVETNHEIMEAVGPELLAIDHFILWVFIAELALLIAARRLNFFKDPWCVFDFLVVIIAFVPATGSLSVLRALRVLRVLRLINKVRSMRTVVGALLSSLPGLGSVFSLILIIFYVSAVIATNMFSADFPERFGSLSTSLYTLFQVMTLEGWSEEIARPVMEVFPSSWVFFIFFILSSTFIVVNLFVAVIVDSINSVRSAETSDAGLVIEEEIRNLRNEISELKSLVNDIHKKTGNS